MLLILVASLFIGYVVGDDAGCYLPFRKEFNIIYNADCKQNACPKEGQKVDELTRLKISCEPGFLLDSDHNKTICVEGAWLPPIPSCKKACTKLKKIQFMTTECSFNGNHVDCDKPLKAGSVMKLNCQPAYQFEYRIDYSEIKCDETGEWDNALINCVPQCGRRASNLIPLIHDGDTALYGETPWQAAIYDVSKSKVLICGGTIVSPYAILSAAHCFFDKATNEKRSAKNYEVVVGKVKRNYTIRDSDVTQYFKVVKIEDNDYLGVKQRYGNDIAILELNDTIKFSAYVMPACLRKTWSSYFINPSSSLKVAGWGLTEENVYSEVLKVTDLPFIRLIDCKKMLADISLSDYLSENKFCFGNYTGPKVDIGDSGSGLLYQDPTEESYYVYGIVSYRDSTADISISVGTNIQYYFEWIINIRKSINDKRNKDRTSQNCNLPEAIEGLTYTITCGRNRIIKCNKNPGEKVPEQTRLTYTCKYTNEKFIALCLDGIWESPEIECKETKKVNNSCGVETKTSVVVTINGKSATITSVPWHVMVYHKTRNLYISGILISRRLVMTEYYEDNYNGTEFEVSVSKYTTYRSVHENIYEELYQVKNKYSHAKKDSAGQAGFKFLYMLETARDIEFNDGVQPVCVLWNNYEFSKTQDIDLKVPDWFKVSDVDVVHDAEAIYNANDDCNKNQKADAEMFCISRKDGQGIGMYGPGVVYKKNDGLYYLIGIAHSFDGKDRFINIAKYTKWMQEVKGIVHPGL